MTALSDDDIGKEVVNMDDETIGMVTGIEGGRAYVDPDPSITDKIKSTLGWDSIDANDYAIEQEQIEQITNKTIRVRR